MRNTNKTNIFAIEKLWRVSKDDFFVVCRADMKTWKTITSVCNLKLGKEKSIQLKISYLIGSVKSAKLLVD